MTELETLAALFGAQGATGTVIRRQTTLWDIAVAVPAAHAPSRTWRISYRGRAESRVPEAGFTSLALATEHPLLIDYHEPWLNLYTTGILQPPAKLMATLQAAVVVATNGFRSVKRYLNPATEAVLLDGYGLLLSGPSSLVRLLAPLVEGSGLVVSVLPGHPARPDHQALLMGSGFIVAKGFVAGGRDA